MTQRCSEPDCREPRHTREWCRGHYRSKLASGEIATVAKRSTNGEAAAFLDELIRDGIDLKRRRKRRRACVIWPFARSGGYARIGAGTQNPYGTTVAHRIVCQEVHGDPPHPLAESAHTCGNGAGGCIEASHLYWAAHARNMQDMVEHGTSPRGKRNGHVKLTEAQVLQARRLRRKGWYYTELAKRYGVSHHTVRSAVIGKLSWAWL